MNQTRIFLFLILSLGLILSSCHNPEKVLPTDNGHWSYVSTATEGSNTYNYSGDITLKKDFKGTMNKNDWGSQLKFNIPFNWSYDKSTKEITLGFLTTNFTNVNGQNWKFKITESKAKTEKWEGDVIESGLQYHHVMILTFMD